MSELIETKKNVLGGQPVIKGTRIPVARIVALYVQGYKLKDFRDDYPYLTLTKKDLHNIFAYYENQLAK